MEQRMTVCNMTIEGGGKAGMIAPTRRPSSGMRANRACLGTSMRRSSLARNCRPTRERPSIPKSTSTRRDLSPMVTWGTTLGMVIQVVTGTRAGP